MVFYHLSVYKYSSQMVTEYASHSKITDLAFFGHPIEQSFLHQWCMAGCLSPFQGCHKERSKSYEFLYFFYIFSGGGVVNQIFTQFSDLICWVMLSLSLMMIWTILIMIQLSEWESMIRWKVGIFHDLGGILVRLRVGDDQKGHNGNIQDMRP